MSLPVASGLEKLSSLEDTFLACCCSHSFSPSHHPLSLTSRLVRQTFDPSQVQPAFPPGDAQPLMMAGLTLMTPDLANLDIAANCVLDSCVKTLLDKAFLNSVFVTSTVKIVTIVKSIVRDDPQDQIVCFFNIVQTAFITLYTCTALQRVFEQC